MSIAFFTKRLCGVVLGKSTNCLPASQMMMMKSVPSIHRTLATAVTLRGSFQHTGISEDRVSSGKRYASNWYSDKKQSAVNHHSLTRLSCQSLPLFSPTGMALFRVYPATFTQVPDGRFVAGFTGSVRFTFYPLNENSEISRRFDTSRPINMSLRGSEIGLLLDADPRNLTTPVIHQNAYGSIELLPQDELKEENRSEGLQKKIILRGRSGRPMAATSCVDVALTSGQFLTVQTLLKYVAPSLFGWQVLLDPTLTSNYMNLDFIRNLEEQRKHRKEIESMENFFS